MNDDTLRLFFASNQLNFSPPTTYKIGCWNITNYTGQDFHSKARENRTIMMSFDGKVNGLTLILLETKYLTSLKHNH